MPPPDLALLPAAFFTLFYLAHHLLHSPCVPPSPRLPARSIANLALLLSAPPAVLLLIHTRLKPAFLLPYLLAALYILRVGLEQPRLLVTPHTLYLCYVFLAALLTLATPLHLTLFTIIAVVATLRTPPRFSNAVHRQSTVPPRVTTTSLYTFLSFSWISHVITTGHQRPLTTDDIPPLDPGYATTHSARHLYAIQARVHATHPGASLLRVLTAAFGRRILIACIVGMIRCFVSFAPSVILRYILLSLQASSSITHGVYLALLLFSCQLCQSIIAHQWFDVMSCTAVQLRAALNNYIYTKSTRLSNPSRGSYSTGQIQNLMATDAYDVSEATLDITFLVIIIQQICIVLFLLQHLLGWVPTITTFCVVVLFLPLQGYLITKTKQFRETASGVTDERVKLVSEGIKGIKLVKLYAWEIPFVNKILETRENELTYIRKVTITQAFNAMVVTSLPMLLVITAFAVYLTMGNTLDAAVVFPVIAVFNVIRAPLIWLPPILLGIARGMASLSRIDKFSKAEELTTLEGGQHAIDQEYLHLNDADVAAVDASFAWDPSNTAPSHTLSSISFEIPAGSLVAIVGPTGGGKSALLSAFLSELSIVSGKAGVRRNRSISYCDQIPFIQNATLRDNILFGKQFDPAHYQNTIRVCSLEPDLEILPGGDNTEIGSRGVNLSGGQRARVSLARAVYARADICLLDDPLCAVDARVGKAIFTNCVVSALRGTTRLLTTNQIHFAASPDVDFVMVVRDGKIAEMGSRTSLLASEATEFSQLVRAAGDVGAGDVLNTKVHEDNNPVVSNHDAYNDVESITSSISYDTDHETMNTDEGEEKSLMSGNTKKDYGSIKGWRLTKTEAKEHGRVRLQHYATYLRALGFWQWVVPFLLFAVGTKSLTLSVDVLFSEWSEQDGSGNTIYQLLIFVGLGLTSVLTTAGSVFAIAYGSIRASGILHESLLLSVFGAPSSFFHSTPEGQIINRFHSDMDKVDSLIVPTLISVIRLLQDILFTFGVMIWASPWIILAIVPATAVCIFIQEYYRKSSVDLRRLESVARSPLYSHFSESLDGISTIRAYKDVPRGSRVNSRHSDTLCRTFYSIFSANRWLGTRMECASATLIFLTTILTISSPALRLSAGKAGLILTYVIQMLNATLGFVRLFTQLESDLSSVERISEYSAPSFPREEKGSLENLYARQKRKRQSFSKAQRSMTQANQDVLIQSGNPGCDLGQWPKDGYIDFEDVEMRYRSDLNPALRNISFTVQAGEHIGIVGRTGAGKSSAINCLFRLQELGKGRIIVDGTSISDIPLHKLRSSIGIIPQEPVCFSGTIWSNLDMSGEYSEAEVQRALDDCGLHSTTSRKVALEDEVSENGSNLSVGQRQLLCLGRVLLKESRILVLDEATSSVTNEIDEIIQTTLREKMKHCTIVTIAHRLHTVMRSDKIMVMDKGEIAEIGTPSELLGRDSRLSAMVDETGPATAAHLRKMARQSSEGTT